MRAVLSADELSRVRYVEYSYWEEISGATRLPADAARRIRARGERFPPLILVGHRRERLVCLEGKLRLTAHALEGFPVEVECLVGTAATMGRWAQ